MIIISHRGYWLEVSEKNTEVAFRRSFELNFGTETDVRDCLGELVISHDPPAGQEMCLDAFLSLLGGKELCLAMNVKADGLAQSLNKAMRHVDRKHWFAFDMSVPDMRAHLAVGNPVFARMSEVEKEPAWFDRVEGIWLDGFENTWFDPALIQNLIDQGKRVCVVSSELHGRNQADLWALLAPLSSHDQLILCTDLPEQAQKYFNEVPR